jgi:hypothetical protein
MLVSDIARSGLFLYAKYLQRLARFYESVVGMRRLHESPESVVLQSDGVQLVVHEIPPDIADTITITSPPRKREDTALKFFFTVSGIAGARTAASALGGKSARNNGVARALSSVMPGIQKAMSFRCARVDRQPGKNEIANYTPVHSVWNRRGQNTGRRSRTH